MDRILPVAGTTMKAAEIAAAYNAKVLSLQKDTIRMQGDMVVKLINAAVNTPVPNSNNMETGRILNITA